MVFAFSDDSRLPSNMMRFEGGRNKGFPRRNNRLGSTWLLVAPQRQRETGDCRRE
jgi:hypothetical protein